MRMTDLKPGWAVVGNDGHRLGTVRDVSQNYVRVSGAGLPDHLHIPASAIANVDNGVIYLNLTKHEATEMGWEQPPRGDDTLETNPESDLHRHI